MTSVITWLLTDGVKLFFLVVLMLAILNKKKRDSFLDGTLKLLTDPSSLEGYPEGMLVRLEKRYQKALTVPVKANIKRIRRELSMFWEKYEWVAIGQLILLALFLGFILADLIIIINALEAAGYPLDFLGERWGNILGRYALAISMGSFFSVIAAGIIIDKRQEDSLVEFPLEGFSRFMAYVILVLSIFSTLALGLKPLAVRLQLGSWSESVFDLSTNFIVRANVIALSLLILKEAVKGLRTVWYCGKWISLCVAIAFHYGVGVFAALGRISIDLLIRAGKFVILAIGFVISPLDFLASYVTERNQNGENR